MNNCSLIQENEVHRDIMVELDPLWNREIEILGHG